MDEPSRVQADEQKTMILKDFKPMGGINRGIVSFSFLRWTPAIQTCTAGTFFLRLSALFAALKLSSTPFFHAQDAPSAIMPTASTPPSPDNNTLLPYISH